MSSSGPVTLKVELGALTELPVMDGRILWESHKRGRNWMAVISKDPQAPNGLARSFFKPARGDYFYILPADLKVGDPLEIGADYYSGGGHPARRRWYGYVVAVADDAVVVQECATAAAAIRQGQEHGVGPERTDSALQAARVALTALTPEQRRQVLDEFMVATDLL